jgi:hypothetical protein
MKSLRTCSNCANRFEHKMAEIERLHEQLKQILLRHTDTCPRNPVSAATSAAMRWRAATTN